MATNYPTSLDTATELPAGTTLAAQDLDDFPHSDVHGNANDAIIAIETELGTSPSGSESTVKDRLDTIQTPSTGSLDSGKIRYAKSNGIVHVWTTAVTNGGTLPVGFRPAAMVTCHGYADGGATEHGDVEINTSGVISTTTTTGDPTVFSVSFAAA